MGSRRGECLLSFFSPDSRKPEGFVYLGNPGLWAIHSISGANVVENWAIRLPSGVEVFLTFGWHRDSAEGEHFADPVGMDEIEGDCYSYIRGCREKRIDRVRGILIWCIYTCTFESWASTMHLIHSWQLYKLYN